MNTDNISALSAMLVRAGFDEGVSYRLLQRVCFHPASFTLLERMQRGQDVLTCVLHFERRGVEYVCGYYDVGLLRGIVMPQRVVSGIDLAELDTAMAGNDWRMGGDASAFRLGEASTWEREKSIEQFVSQLAKLSATEEGKHFADALKIKYWVDAGLEQIVGNLNAIRSKFEISQRVYFIDGEAIPVDEAYRFLLNKWMEKKMQAKRKEQTSGSHEDETLAGAAERGKQLSQKKKKIKDRRITRER